MLLESEAVKAEILQSLSSFRMTRLEMIVKAETLRYAQSDRGGDSAKSSLLKQRCFASLNTITPKSFLLKIGFTHAIS